MAASQTTPFDRFNDALRGLDDQIQDLRGQFDDRRKDLEKDLRSRAKDIRSQLRKSDLYKRATSVRDDWEDQVDQARGRLYQVFGLATRSDIEKLNKKLNSISRKLSDIAKEAKEEVGL
jgi:tetrahydromethanopterin S-methyltransferase subunit G